MTSLPTSEAMVHAAQDALDVAAADEAVALAKWQVARANRIYAEGVLNSVLVDCQSQPA